MPGTIPIMYSVPVQSHLLPVATPAAFTGFANCKIEQFAAVKSGKFNCLMYQDNA